MVSAKAPSPDRLQPARGRSAQSERVNPNEVVEIVVRFTNYSGRHMYHCHILEHEDRDMMRPFVTMPMELMPFMA